MGWYTFILVTASILTIIGSIFFWKTRSHILKLWNQTSKLEIQFYRKLTETIQMYIAHESILLQFTDAKPMQVVKANEKTDLRKADLTHRQEVFKALQTLYVKADMSNHPSKLTLCQTFELLQKQRLNFNSKVLYYNQIISGFPVSYLAKKIGLKEKQYFG